MTINSGKSTSMARHSVPFALQPASGTVSVERHGRIQRVTSSSGVEAWLVEDYTVPLLALEFAFEGGSSQDAPGKAGTANILSGLLEEGAGPYDSQAFLARVEDLALDMSFHSGRDHFSGNMRSLIKHRDAAFEMLRLALCEAHLDKEAIARVKAQVIAGMKHSENDPGSIASRNWHARAFPDHPYGIPGDGTYASVANIEREDLLGMSQRLFTRSNLKVAVVGAIDATSLAGLLDHSFGGLPEKSTTLVKVPPVLPKGLGTREIISLDVPQSVIKFGAAGPARNSPEFMASFVANHILGGGVFSARLFKEVREKRGLAYSVYSALSPSRSASLFVGSTATKNERAGEALQVIEEQIADMANTGPTAEELSSAKKYLTGSYALRFDTSAKIAGQLVQIQLDGLGIDYIERRNAEVESVTLDAVKQAAHTLFGSGKMLVSVVGKPEGL